MDALNQIDATPLAKVWKKVGIRHHHGINLPLSAISSKWSLGIGEYPDLRLVIEIVKKAGMDVIQLLPLNDSFLDPSPYNALSATALNPAFIGLRALKDIPKDLELLLKEFDPFLTSKRVHYQEIYQKKESWLHKYVLFHKEKIQNCEKYQEFFNQEMGWLKPYALFKYLKARFDNDYWKNWPNPFRNPSTNSIKKWAHEYEEELFPYYAIQFFAYKQLQEIKHFSQEQEVLIKGDIPILISPDSADVWSQQYLFDLHYAAGAPPDIFNPEGQYWGFPLYNWSAIEKNQYAFWRERLRYAEHFYNLFRIDHVIGFFRIWGIKRGFPPREGQFFPEKTPMMMAQGNHLLQMIIDCSTMLPIAEDLGVIPDRAKEILSELGIPGTKVFRWERTQEPPIQFVPFREYNPISMSCVSTHDSTTLAQWWRDETYESIPFAKTKNWNYSPILSKEMRREILYDIHHSASLFHINLFQEYLSLVPSLSWENIDDDRINLPGYILPTNWTYRFKKKLEEILDCEEFFVEMQKILS